LEELLTLYVGTSFRKRLSGTGTVSSGPAEGLRGEAAGAGAGEAAGLLTSELLDRAEEARGRELVIVVRASSMEGKLSTPEKCAPCFHSSSSQRGRGKGVCCCRLPSRLVEILRYEYCLLSSRLDRDGGEERRGEERRGGDGRGEDGREEGRRWKGGGIGHGMQVRSFTV
jgi:hypothetical protein